MSSLPGHLRWHAAQPDRALDLVLREYDQLPEFRADCVATRVRIDATGGFAVHPRLTQQALDETAALAHRWNLDRIPQLRDWHYAGLRDALRHVGDVAGGEACGLFSPFGLARGQFIPERPAVQFDGSVWHWRLHMGESLADLRDRICANLGVARKGCPSPVLARLAQLPAEARANGWTLSDAKHSWATHAAWLFLRLCPYPRRVRRPIEIANAHMQVRGEYVSDSAVRLAVNHLAAQLKIELPPARRGRPPQQSKRPRAAKPAI